jgi:ribosomal protein S18 acetylase RimI-like enzyme
MSSAISLRAIREDDREFLCRVYASTRREELASVPWTAEQKDAFLRMQFRAQDTHYRAHYPHAEFSIILLDGCPVGRLYLDRRADEIRIVDIALLPEHRGAGIGSSLLRGILAEAARTGKAVTIHVEHNNPALRLYRRLGFTPIGDAGVYTLMEWRPGPPA